MEVNLQIKYVMGYCKTKGFLTSAEDRAVRIQCRKTIYINVRKTILLRKSGSESLWNFHHQMFERKVPTCDRSHRKMTIKQWGTTEILMRLPSD